MFRYGFSYYSGCSTPLDAFIAFSKELGCSYIELQVEPPLLPEQMAPDQVDDLRRVLSDNDLEPTVHGTLDDVNLSSMKEVMRTASVQLMKDAIDFASQVGSSIFVIHAGVCPADQLSRLTEAQNQFRRSLAELTEYALTKEIFIAVENKQLGASREIILLPDEHAEYVSEFYEHGARAAFDIGHAHTTGENVVEYLRKIKHLLIEVHLHDNDGLMDTHLALGHGTADIRGVLDELQKASFSGPIIMELKTEEDMRAGAAFLMDVIDIPIVIDE